MAEPIGDGHVRPFRTVFSFQRAIVRGIPDPGVLVTPVNQFSRLERKVRAFSF
jgi:hypothetical protein